MTVTWRNIRLERERAATGAVAYLVSFCREGACVIHERAPISTTDRAGDCRCLATDLLEKHPDRQTVEAYDFEALPTHVRVVCARRSEHRSIHIVEQLVPHRLPFVGGLFAFVAAGNEHPLNAGSTATH